MTDLIQALSTALARLATLEDIVSRIDQLEITISEMQSTVSETVLSIDRRVDTLERTLDLVEINGFHEARFDRLDTLLHELGTSVARTDDRVSMLESDDGEDLDDRVGAILDRKLDHVLEDAIDSALSGREITVTL